jgi:D-beta-D-heptose 7-phosphate kinase/D-beta-D-heptose 1-phosphate adenosyltransferase
MATITPLVQKIPSTFSSLKILVIGDLILDKYVWGEVSRTSPEAPVPIVLTRSEQYVPGGAANVVSNLRAMDASVTVMGIVGADDYGNKLIKLLADLGAHTEKILQDSNRPTILKTRIIAQGQQLIRIDQEKCEPIDHAMAQQLANRYRQILEGFDGVILSDYQKGLLTADFLQALISEARQCKVPIIADPKGADYSKYKGVNLLTPNVKEAQEASHIPIEDGESLCRAGFHLLKSVHADAIAITRGRDGVSVFQPPSRVDHIAGHTREVYDITGAGDTFISHLGLGLFSGMTYVEAAQLGNYAGAIVVGKLGVASVSPQELLAFIKEETYSTKRKTLAELTVLVNDLKSQGKRVVFTNGCFDLLHIGHIKFLQQARECGDCLIVALNSDSSVRALKGPPRPIIGENERADILAALNSVDYVTIFYDETPEAVIKALQPDVLVKGKNIPLEEVVGREIVESYGGQVRLLPVLHDISTSKLLDLILNKSGGTGGNA